MKSKFIFKSIFFLLASLKFSHGVVFFPTNSAYGIIAAIAVPLDLPHRNVFLSYNFEANYNLPYTWDLPPIAIFAAIAVPLDLAKQNVFISYNFEANYNLPASFSFDTLQANFEDIEDLTIDGRQCTTNCTAGEESETESRSSDGEMENSSTEETTEGSATEEEEVEEEETTTTMETETERTPRKSKAKGKLKRSLKPHERSLLSRTNFYHILNDKFERSGYKGQPCLLRMICETNASELGDINGILGNLIHIIFSPSTSRYEELPLVYYQAEWDGRHDHCDHYKEECSESLLDLISSPLSEIIKTMMPNI